MVKKLVYGCAIYQLFDHIFIPKILGVARALHALVVAALSHA